MSLRIATAAVVIFATTTAWSQGADTNGGPLSKRLPAGRRSLPVVTGKQTAGGQNPPSLRQQMEETQSTLTKMHAVLKQMRAKEAKSAAKDPIAAANLNMWELMIGHLDKQFEELRATAEARESFEARRAAMYKAAAAKADAVAQAARAAQAAQQAGATQEAAPKPAEQNSPGPASAPSSPAPAAPVPSASSSPNASPSPN